MTDIVDLLQIREKLSQQLTKIETALAELQQSVRAVDAEISRIRQRREVMVKRGQRMYALLVETRREIERHDALIQQTVEEMAEKHIGQQEGCYVIGGGLAIARMRVNGALYTALVEAFNTS